MSAAPGHRYHLIDGRGGVWLAETTDEHPEPSPIALVSDLLGPVTGAGSWICGRCGHGSESHGQPGHVAYDCVHDPVWNPAARTAPAHEESDAGLGGWETTKWWRCISESGELWAESSDEGEVRRAARPTDTVQRLWVRTEDTEWRDA